MEYAVLLQELAERDLEGAYANAAKHAQDTARIWLERFRATISTLKQDPMRYAVAPEHVQLKREVRQLLHGRRPNVFRVLFIVDGKAVRVVRILRASRRGLRRGDLPP